MARFTEKAVIVDATQFAGGPEAAAAMMFSLGEGCSITMIDNINGALSYKGVTIDVGSWAVVFPGGDVKIMPDAEFAAKFSAA